MNATARPKRPRGAPRKEIGQDKRRFAAVFAVAAAQVRLVPSERTGSLLAAALLAPEGSLASVPAFGIKGQWRHVAGVEAGRTMPSKRFNTHATTGRRSIQIESEGRAVRRTLARIRSTPGGSVWLEKCARWLAICISAKEAQTFDFAAFNLIRLGWSRAEFVRLCRALADV